MTKQRFFTPIKMAKQGHSNIYPETTKPYPTNSERAEIELIGGSRVDTVKKLPPLSLSKEEWLKIGRKMNWVGYENAILISFEREKRVEKLLIKTQNNLNDLKKLFIFHREKGVKK